MSPSDSQPPTPVRKDISVLDRAAKRLFGEAPRAALLLAGARLPEGVTIRREDVSINIAEHRADQVFVPDVPGSPWAIHMEYVTQPDPRDHPNWLYKNGCLNRQLKIPVLLVVVYLEKGDYATFHAGCTLEGGGILNTHGWHVVLLWDFVEAIRHGALRELAPFLSLCLDHPTEEILLEQKAIIKDLDVSEARRAELIALSMMIGRRQFSESALEAAFREELPMLKEMEFVQEWMAECRQEGLFQGREEGREEGRQEGRQEGLEQGIEKGLEQGIERGREEGVLIGRIEFAGQLLGRPLPSRADLLAMLMEELQALAAELDGELRR